MTLRDALYAETVSATHLGYVFTVSDMSAAAWLPVLSDQGRDVLIARELMTEDSQDKLADLMESGRFRLRDMHMTSRKLIAAVGGRPWWEVMSLLTNIWDGGELLGEMLRTGVRPRELRVSELVTVSFMIYTKGLDKTERFKFDAKLSTPPAWAEPEELMDWDDGMDFAATARTLQNMPGASVG